jgi:DNA repair exonuclease SbcCD ATPase subunit
MRVLLPIFAAGLLAQAPPAKDHAHPKSIAEKKHLLADLESKESKLKDLLHKEKELKTLEGKEKQLKKLEEKKAKLEKLESEEKQLKTLEEKKAKLEKLESEEKKLKTLEEKKAKLEKLEEKEKELKVLEDKKAKIEKLEGMEKKLEEKKEELKTVNDELKTIDEKKAKLEAAAAAKAPEAPKAAPAAAPTKNMDAAERLLKSLGQIKKLKGTFAADENFGGAMQEELSKGSTIWSAIEALESTATSTKNGTALAAAMNSFTNTMGKTLHAIDQKDEISSEEYVLGLLAHHKHNATEQRRILGNFTNLHSVEELLAEKPAPKDLAVEYAGMLDKEHPAAKPLTAFLQRVM